MDAEKRTQNAILLARAHLTDVIGNPEHTDVLISMIANEVRPEDLEDMISRVLEYLEKTKPEEEA